MGPTAPDPVGVSLLASWRTNRRVTSFLVQSVPTTLWDAPAPGVVPRKTVRMIAAHLHNARRSWIRTLGEEHGITVPDPVDHRRVSRRQLLSALRHSGEGIERLIATGLETGRLPPSRRYVWRNLPLDVGHVLTYFVAHEAHHRGQIVMLARQVNLRLPRPVAGELWNWTRLSREE